MPDGAEQVSYLPEEVFDFKIERTDAPLIARAGLVLPYQMAKALGLPRAIDRELPGPGSERGYLPSASLMPIILMHPEGILRDYMVGAKLWRTYGNYGAK